MSDRLVLPLGPEGLTELRRLQPNHCVVVYGPGPEGKTCGSCGRLITKRWADRTYFKCPYRGNTNGPGTDHRKRWPACRRWVSS